MVSDWSKRETKHTHACVQCSHTIASVGLAQAHHKINSSKHYKAMCCPCQTIMQLMKPLSYFFKLEFKISL